MAIKDTLLEIASNAAVDEVGVGLALVGTPINTSKARNIGGHGGRTLFLIIGVRTAITSGGAATVSFSLVSDAQSPLAVDGTATVHMRTPAVPVAQLVAGFQYPPMELPPEGTRDYEQWIGVLQDVGGFALTAGNIDAYLTADPPGAWKPPTMA